VPIPAVISWRRPGRGDRLRDGRIGQRVDDPVPVDAAGVGGGEDLLERRQQRAVWSILLAGREDHGQVEDCRGAREPDHVGLDLAAWRRLDDALEHAGLVVDQEEHHAVPGQWFSGHLLAPSDGLDQYPLRAALN
jgi:hypothetical protein